MYWRTRFDTCGSKGTGAPWPGRANGSSGDPPFTHTSMHVVPDLRVVNVMNQSMRHGAQHQAADPAKCLLGARRDKSPAFPTPFPWATPFSANINHCMFMGVHIFACLRCAADASSQNLLFFVKKRTPINHDTILPDPVIIPDLKEKTQAQYGCWDMRASASPTRSHPLLRTPALGSWVRVWHPCG